MQLHFRLSLLLCVIMYSSHAQTEPDLSLDLGDSAPALRVSAWLKGQPIHQFEKGKVYVIEFWATWCKPCIAAMPHLSSLADEYKGKVNIIGIDIYEKKTVSIKKIKAFVDSMGARMNFSVAAEDSNFIERDWLDASGEKVNGIPRTFVVNAEGRLAWIGHPKKGLAEILPKIINNDWNIDNELTQRNSDRRRAKMDDSLSYELMRFQGNPLNPLDFGKPDSTLAVISEVVAKEPKLRYAAAVAAYTFSSLLIENPHKAYEYGKALLMKSNNDDPPYHLIWGNISYYEDKLKLPEEIYQLGLEAYLARIQSFPETVDPKFYHEMAGFYWQLNEKSKAITTEEKAINALKNQKIILQKNLTAFEKRLRQYRKDFLGKERSSVIDKKD